MSPTTQAARTGARNLVELLAGIGAGMAILAGLAACDPPARAPAASTPAVGAVAAPNGRPATAGSPGDPSVPSAAAVVGGPDPAASQSDAVRKPESGLSAAEEKKAMPMPGQNNDHSAPVTKDKP